MEAEVQVKSTGLCQLRGVYHARGNQSYAHCPFELITSQLDANYHNWHVTRVALSTRMVGLQTLASALDYQW